MKELTHKRKLVIIGVTIIFILAVVGVSYALLKQLVFGSSGKVVYQAGSLNITLNEDSSSAISLSNTVPMTEAQGKETSAYKFALNNTGDKALSYEIYLDNDDTALSKCGSNCELVSDNNLKYELKKDATSSVSLLNSRMITSDTITAKTSINFELRLWLDHEADNSAQGKYFFGKLRVEAKQKVEGELTLTEALLANYTNKKGLTSYEQGNKSKMYVFDHEKTEQTDALTDYRYIGNIPNNYFTFNDEMWRIIGVFTVEDGNGKKEQRVKIMRDESIGEYSWDNTTVENQYGKNRWSDARLNYLLNPGHESESIGGSLYWNRGSGKCYAGQNNAVKDCDFTATGLTSNAKSQIELTKWYLGGYDFTGLENGLYYHRVERGTTIYNSASYPREINWLGFIGLVYPSDYKYTYSLGIDNACYNKPCSSGIPSSSWMFNGHHQWTISSSAITSSIALLLSSPGNIGNDHVYYMLEVHPTVFLKANVQFLSGTGSNNDPFKIS